MTTALILIIVFCIVFDYINGFHDAANSIATVVSTKVLTPFQAVCWAALFNFVAFFIFKEAKIAETIAKTVDFSKVEISNLHKYIIIISGLSAAIFWNLLTWWFGIPSSSSHTLYGGFIGAAVTAIGFQSINSDFVILTLGFIVLAPLMGMVLSITISLITIQNNFYKKSIIWILIFGSIIFALLFKKNFKIAGNNQFLFELFGIVFIGIFFLIVYFIIYKKKYGHYNTNKIYKRLQLLSSAIVSIAHGGSDAQKVMGIMKTALIINGTLSIDSKGVPTWVGVLCYSAIALGTLTGGWRIIKTMGNKITKVEALEGVCAETAGAITLFTATNLGALVSSTHVITGSVIGVGAAKRFSAVRWGVTINLLAAWILTIPISATLAGITYIVLHFFFLS